MIDVRDGFKTYAYYTNNDIKPLELKCKINGVSFNCTIVFIAMYE